MKRLRVTATALMVAGGLAACGMPAAAPSTSGQEKLRVVTTTPLLADLVRAVAGDEAHVSSLMPAGVDPHSYEPTLRASRDAAYADVAFSNYMMLEPSAVLRTLDANLPDGVQNVWLAERSTKHGATLRTMVEKAALEATWLGFASHDHGTQPAARVHRTAHIQATAIRGPGDASAYITETFGAPRVWFASSDGVDARDVASVAAGAHTHASWSFTEAGHYTLELQASMRDERDSRINEPIGDANVHFAVGAAPQDGDREPIDGGHVDIIADTEQGLMLGVDTAQGVRVIDPDDAVIVVPPKTLAVPPSDPDFRFIGRWGEPVYQLPQAVLGKHVHGEIDPHLWHDVRNTMAYVRVICEELSQADPVHASLFADHRDTYLAELATAHTYLRQAIGRVPQSSRKLLTTHDGFGYLTDGYGLENVGTLTGAAGVEPSIADRVRIDETLRVSGVGAVFTVRENRLGSDVLAEIAAARGVQVCELASDTLTDEVPTYLALIKHNADELERCLT